MDKFDWFKWVDEVRDSLEGDKGYKFAAGMQEIERQAIDTDFYKECVENAKIILDLL